MLLEFGEMCNFCESDVFVEFKIMVIVKETHGLMIVTNGSLEREREICELWHCASTL
jgi:hypothetical protein